MKNLMFVVQSLIITDASHKSIADTYEGYSLKINYLGSLLMNKMSISLSIIQFGGPHSTEVVITLSPPPPASPAVVG